MINAKERLPSVNAFNQISTSIDVYTHLAAEDDDIRLRRGAVNKSKRPGTVKGMIMKSKGSRVDFQYALHAYFVTHGHATGNGAHDDVVVSKDFNGYRACLRLRMIGRSIVSCTKPRFVQHAFVPTVQRQASMDEV